MTSVVVDTHRPNLVETASASFSPCRTYRYALTRRWSPDPLAAFVMLNPSTADAFRPDPTIARCIRFAKSWTAGGIVVLNLYALRSTDPAALLRHPEPVGPDNDTVIAGTLSSDDLIGPLIVAWGAHPKATARAAWVLELLRARHNGPLLCLGRTKTGMPRHPLYLARSTAAEPYTT